MDISSTYSCTTSWRSRSYRACWITRSTIEYTFQWCMAWNAFRREIVIYFFVIHVYSFDPTKARGCKQRDSYVYGVVVVSCYAWAVKTSRPLAIDIILSPSKKGRLVKFLWPPTSSILSDCEQFQMQMELQNFQAYRSMQDYSKSYFLIGLYPWKWMALHAKPTGFFLRTVCLAKWIWKGFSKRIVDRWSIPFLGSPFSCRLVVEQRTHLWHNIAYSWLKLSILRCFKGKYLGKTFH